MHVKTSTLWHKTECLKSEKRKNGDGGDNGINGIDHAKCTRISTRSINTLPPHPPPTPTPTPCLVLERKVTRRP